jgi:mannose/cellobiose epimerase-like protein (N-acyl-D-glucosamine 2-epimerase family)
VGPDGEPADGKECYAHAFVVLAASSCAVAGRPGAARLLSDALEVFDTRFWDEAAGLCVDRWDTAWTALDPYRGLNATMHAVEALLAASDATGDPTWRQRAARICTAVVGWAAQHDGRLPEHFDERWAPQLEHNADRPDDPFQPYGATVGHALEWSRLLLQVEASCGGDLLPTARALFDRAVTDGWAADGADGFVYTTDWDGRPVVHDRMHWVVAEAIGAAAALHRRTGEHGYAEHYARWWDYADAHLLDRERGSWRHQLDRHNRPTATVWAGKPDLYHAVQATLLPQLPLTPSLASALAGRA